MPALTRRALLAASAAAGLAPAAACARPSGPAPASPQPRPVAAPVRLVPIAEGLEHPWGMTFLPDGRLLVTERPGRLRLLADGRLSAPLAGVPEVVDRGQGGLLDVAIGPDFAGAPWVYLSFAEAGPGGAGTAVARGRLGGAGLEGTEVIWRQRPKVSGNNHWGSRLVFRPDGTLFVTLGDRYNYKEQAQNLESTLGKIIRINPDGSVPADNPFVGRSGALPEIWSVGHRNVQAATLHPDTGQLWTVEHGARGGDELNQPEAGRNYGWPVITYGIDYSGASIGIGAERAGMEQPVYYWDPVIAPSGATFLTSDRYEGWRGDLFIGSLNPGQLVRLTLADGQVVAEHRHLDEFGQRIRAVRQGPDGLLHITTDASEGQVLRLEPGA